MGPTMRNKRFRCLISACIRIWAAHRIRARTSRGVRTRTTVHSTAWEGTRVRICILRLIGRRGLHYRIGNGWFGTRFWLWVHRVHDRNRGCRLIKCFTSSIERGIWRNWYFSGYNWFWKSCELVSRLRSHCMTAKFVPQRHLISYFKRLT